MSALMLPYLPQDVLSNILDRLRLGDIVHLRRTCSVLQNKISNDKQLWVNLMEKHVFSIGCRLPTQIQQRLLSNIDASTIEFWMRTALAAHKAYGGSVAHRISILRGLAFVTWVKIVRGRWYLVATSDNSQSRLSILDGLYGLQSDCKKEFFLEGPVMDGVMEDVASSINIALSIGTREPFIQVMTLCMQESTIQLLTLAIIPKAYCTRLIHGRLVGFAVNDGDDAHAAVADWCSRKVWLLDGVPPFLHGESQSGVNEVNEQGTCRAMSVWVDLIVVAFKDDIRLFKKPLLSSGRPPECIAVISMGLAFSARDVYLGSYCNSPLSCWTSGHTITCSSMYMLIRDADNVTHYLELRCEPTTECESGYRLNESFFQRNITLANDDRLFVCAIGSTYSTVCYITISDSAGPCLYVASVRDMQSIEEIYARAVGSAIFTAEFPVLHMFPCVDFDDGYGILLIGNSLGELCVVEFSGSEYACREGIDNNLPIVDSRCFPYSETTLIVSGIPLPLDLPLIYTLGQDTDEDSWMFQLPMDIPREVVDDRINSWMSIKALQGTSDFWSNDWQSFDLLNQWLVPCLLWDVTDLVYMNSPIVCQLREAYRIFGEPVPLWYHVIGLSSSVIFKIGSRPFLLKYSYGLDGVIQALYRINLSLKQVVSGGIPEVEPLALLHCSLLKVCLDDIVTIYDYRVGRIHK